MMTLDERTQFNVFNAELFKAQVCLRSIHSIMTDVIARIEVNSPEYITASYCVLLIDEALRSDEQCSK
jgi:hypothetical protein